MLVALATLTGSHPLAACTIDGPASASHSLILEMTIGFTDGTGPLASFLRCGKAHVLGIARQIAVGRVIFVPLIGSVNGLGRCVKCCNR